MIKPNKRSYIETIFSESIELHDYREDFGGLVTYLSSLVKKYPTIFIDDWDDYGFELRVNGEFDEVGFNRDMKEWEAYDRKQTVRHLLSRLNHLNGQHMIESYKDCLKQLKDLGEEIPDEV